MGAKINIINKTLQSPFHWACIGGDLRIVKFLDANGAESFLSESFGYTALHLACHYNHIIIVIYLLSKGLQIDKEDKDGHTPLQWAAYFGYDDLLRYLIKQGANPHHLDNLKMNALHWAAGKGKIKCCHVLLQSGVSLDVKDMNGKTAEDRARESNMYSTVEYLQDVRENPEILQDISKRKNSNYWFWLLFPFFILPLLFFLIELLPFTLFLAVTFLVGGPLSYFLLIPRWVGLHTNNPFFASWFLSSFIISAIIYFIKIIQGRPSISLD